MRWISLGAIFGGLSVMLGALGAHSLKARLAEKQLATFHTATHYLGYHALGLIFLGILCVALGPEATRALKKVGIFFTAGIFMFSGSLYILALGGPRFFGPVTPFGGLAFMIGWFTLAWTAFKLSSKSTEEPIPPAE